MEKLKQQFEKIVQEMIDWNTGTIYKLYDTEETCEVLEEDTRKYIKQLWELFEKNQTKAGCLGDLLPDISNEIAPVGVQYTQEFMEGYFYAKAKLRELLRKTS